MKIRMGFVSNSSTTSFAIYGTAFDLDSLCEKLNLKTDDWEGVNAWKEELEKRLQKKDGRFEVIDNPDIGVCIGIDFVNGWEEETFGEFKKKIKKILKKEFGDSIEVRIHAETWMNG